MRALRHRLSQRGACLLLLALLDLVYAQGLYSAPPETRATPTYTFFEAIFPLETWAFVWATVGVICLCQAWTPRDRVAYVSAAALKIGWAALHFGAWIANVLPRGYVSAAIWLIAAGFVMILATIKKGGPYDA